MLVSRIKVLCERNKTSINKVEDACGLGHATIRKWDKSSPRLDNVQKVADFLGVSVCELIGDDDV